MSQQRIQKIIAAAGLASRREAERWIEQGRIKVNGRLASLGDKADPDQDRIEVDGRSIGRPEQKVYILLNKPVGYVTTLRDPQGRPVVTDLLANVSERVVPVGRLDLTTEGLLLMTNDGDLALRLAHPSFHVEKTYLARVRGAVSADDVAQLEKGVRLDDGITAPARVRLLRKSDSHSWLEISIHEGRNRQVRRMCEAIGYPVSRLKRIGYAFLSDRGLAPGEYRRLTPAEVGKLKNLSR